MANDKQPWWTRLPAPLDWIKGNVIWDLVKWLVAAALGGIGGAGLLHATVSTGVYLTCLLMSLFALASLAFRKPTSIRIETLPSRMLFEETDLLHRMYRNLDQDFREEVRYPLKHSSWPDFGMEWEYVHVTVFSLKQRLDWMCQVATKVFGEMGWSSESVELFRLSDTTTMVDLLHALEDFGRCCERNFLPTRSSPRSNFAAAGLRKSMAIRRRSALECHWGFDRGRTSAARS